MNGYTARKILLIQHPLIRSVLYEVCWKPSLVAPSFPGKWKFRQASKTLQTLRGWVLFCLFLDTVQGLGHCHSQAPSSSIVQYSVYRKRC